MLKMTVCCFPKEEALVNSLLHLEIPDFGGHVGIYGTKQCFYTEKEIRICTAIFINKKNCAEHKILTFR